MYATKLITSITLILCSITLHAQINFNNPSFEGTPAANTTPSGWLAIGIYSTPDILPGYWDVNLPADNGKTYLGMVVRTDGTNEAIQQELSKALTKGECYQFDLSLARSTEYFSHNRAVKLKVWGSQQAGIKEELLDELGPIENTSWERFTCVFTALASHKYIILEASFDGDKYYAGNILIDNLQPIIYCPAL